MIFEEIPEDQEELYRQSLDHQQLLGEEASVWALGVAASIKNVQAEIAAVEAVLKPLKERLENLNNKLEARKEYLVGIMRSTGLGSAQDGRSKVKLRSAEKVIVTSEKKLPSKYLIAETVTNVDKETILRELKLGVVIEGCQLGKTHFVTIK